MDLVHELVHSLRNTKQRRGQLTAAKQLSELLQTHGALCAAPRRLCPTAPELQPGQLAGMDVHGAFLAVGGLEAALHLLASTEQVSKAAAAELLGAVCLDAVGAAQLAAAGGVAPLVQLLHSAAASGRSGVHAAALSALAVAAYGSRVVQDAAVAAGCVPLLVAILREPCQSDHRHAACVLSELALQHHHAEALLSSGAVPALMPLVTRQELVKCATALTALNRLTDSANPQRAAATAAIVAAGGIPAAVQCLRDSSMPDGPDDDTYTVPQLAAGLLGDMAAACPQLAADIQAAGAVPKLEWMLRNSTHAGERGWTATTLAHIRRLAAVALQDSSPASPPADAPAAVATRRVCAAPGCSNTRGLRSCGGCHVVRYCSPACCKAHWREHKAECRRLQAEAAAAAAVAAEPEP